MRWLLEATLSNAVIATAMALAVVALARFLRHRPAVVHAMWLIVLLKLVTPPLVFVPVNFGWEARPASIIASSGSALEFPGDVRLGIGTGDRRSGTIEARSDSDVTALATELERMRAARELQSTTTSQFGLPVLILWLVGTVVWTVFAAVRIVRFTWLLRAARPCGNDITVIASRTARRLGLRKTPAIVTVDARIPPLVWHAGRAARIVLPSDLVSEWNDEQLELLLAHELAHVKRGDHLVRWFTLAVLAVYWWHPLAWWAVRRLRLAEEQCCDAMVMAVSPSRAHAYAETLLETLDFLGARRSPPHVLASGIGSGGSLQRRCEMILSGRTKFRTGRIAGVLLLLSAIAILPLAGVVRADEESDKKSFEARLRHLEQLVEKLVRINQKGIQRERRLKKGQDTKKKEAVVEFLDFDKDGDLDYRFKEGLPKHMLLFVVADWCSQCATLKPKIEKLRRAGIMTAEIDVTRQTAAVKALGLKEIPAMLVWRNGRVVSRREGLENVTQELVTASVKAAKDRIAKRYDAARLEVAQAELLQSQSEVLQKKKQLEVMQAQVQVLTMEIAELQAVFKNERRSLEEELRAKAKETGGGKPTTRK